MRGKCSRSSATRRSTSTKTSRRRLSNGCARGSRSSNRGVSPDGQERWLNWVIRLPTAELIGYVQATVRSNASAAIAYELSSAYWGRGLASEAIQAMLGELQERYQARSLSAVFKRDNQRSRRLLERLGFLPASPKEHVKRRVEPEELLMVRGIQA